jgi:hypothetical protein
MNSKKNPRNYGFQVAFWAGLIMTFCTCAILLGLSFHILEPLNRLIHLKIKSTRSEIQARIDTPMEVEISEGVSKKDTIVIVEKILQPCTKTHCEPAPAGTNSNLPTDSNSN